MKNLVIVSLLATSVHVFAKTPAVGDKSVAVRICTANYDPSNITARNQWTSKITDFDSVSGKFLYVVSDTSQGYYEEKWTSEEDLGYVNDLSGFCDNMSAKGYLSILEKLKTIIGVIDTCKVTTSSRLIRWYSDKVPFGLVRVLQKDSREYRDSCDWNITEVK